MNSPQPSSRGASRRRPRKPSAGAPAGAASAASPSRSADEVAARRGELTRAANARRKERSAASPAGPGSNPNGGRDRGGNAARPKVDLFAAFDQGEEPSLDATFLELGVPAPLVAALEAGGIAHPFPIQAATMADCMSGRDVLGRGRTGSGKTLAFVLPLLTRLAASKNTRRPGRPRALILVPTRELATQIDAALSPLAKLLHLRSTTVFGGVGPQPQINALRQGVDVVIACPGRLDDHISGGHCRLDDVEITVLDEADHMADMGFLPGVTKLLAQTPTGSQRLLFSATLDNGIDVIVNKFLHNPVLRSVDPAEAAEVKMTHHVLHVAADQRFPVLRDLAAAPGRIMIFTRTKHGAKKLTSTLTSSGVPAVEMHGNLSQNNRTRNLAAFSDGSATAMVATDVAARGIHVDDVALVVHFDPPVDHKVYVHRSGRTARAGAEGTVVTMMTDDQQAEVRDLVKKAGIAPTITRVTQDHALLAEIARGERQFVKVSPVAAASPNNDRSAARGGTPVAAQAATAAQANRPKPPRKGRAGRPAWEPGANAGAAKPKGPTGPTARPAAGRVDGPRTPSEPGTAKGGVSKTGPLFRDDVRSKSADRHNGVRIRGERPGTEARQGRWSR